MNGAWTQENLSQSHESDPRIHVAMLFLRVSLQPPQDGQGIRQRVKRG